MKNIMTAILAAVPNPSPVVPPGLGEKVILFLGWLYWIGISFVLGGFIVAGAAMAYENRSGQGGDTVKRVMYVGVGAMIIGSASTLAGALTGA